MNFMAYGKSTGSRPTGLPVSRNTYIPEKFLAPSKPNNRHDIFFRPQQEDLKLDGKPRSRNRESADDTILTIKATSFFNREDSSLYLAVTEGRGNASCEVGIAAIDIKRPELILSQISDNFWYTGLLTKIAILSPAEILLPQALIDSNSTSKLYLYIKSTYPEVPIRAVPRRQFNDIKALEIIDRIHNSKYQSIRNMIVKKYYALTASSALLQYLEYVMNYSFAPNSLKLRYESKYGCMMIDLDTSHHLELLYPTCKTKDKYASLFGVLDSCVTSIGKRNLRAQILQPSCDMKQIIKTQGCIRELFGNQELFVTLERTLMKFHSVDKLLKFAIIKLGSDFNNASETMITQVLQLKMCLENVPELQSLLSTINNAYFNDIKSVLLNASYTEMLNHINRVIHPDAQLTGGATQFFQRLHAVNTDISPYLDLNRTNYTKLVDTINETISDLSRTHKLPFRMKFIASKGFHIQLALSKTSPSPPLHISLEVLSKTKNIINITTNDLRMLNMRMFDIVQQIHIESNRIITNLVNGIRHNMSQLYDLSGLVSSLDIILSLTKYSINSNGCCPSFSSEMNVIDGVHPILQYNQKITAPVPNGVIANSEYNFFVISGPNMGGKTSYLKMIAMLQILAQLGCFVPAKSATFRLTDKILSRIGFGDRIECNLSGFVLEMRETEYIFKNITPNSIVIIDELCRSTNPEEGEVLAWDICERFIRLIGVSNEGQYFDESDAPTTSRTSNKSIKMSSITSPFIFFVTHFDSITKLQDKFLSVVNLHFSAQEEIIDGKVHLTYDYRIEDGVNQLKNYGISLAQYMNFPSDVISNAVAISKQLRQKELPEPNRNKSNFLFHNSSTTKLTTHQSTILETSTSVQSYYFRLFYNLYADIVSINRMSQSSEEKLELLKRKMKALAEDLPPNVLEMAKKGNLFQIFKPLSNVLSNKPELTRIEEEPIKIESDPQSTQHSTDFSLLSEYSIARRIGVKEKAMYNSKTPIEKLSNPRSVMATHLENDLGNVQSILKNTTKRFPFENQTTSHSIPKDCQFDYLTPDTDFMEQELTQYFSNLSPKGEDIIVEPNVEDFFQSHVYSESSSRTESMNRVASYPYQNASTIVQPAVSSKDYTKSKSTSSNNKSSLSLASRFRLQLPSFPVTDNRILRSPTKNVKISPPAPRVRNSPMVEFTFSDHKEKTTKKHSSLKFDFSRFKDDYEFQIPSTGSRTPSHPINHTKLSDIHEEPFELNLTQFCSMETLNERPFIDNSQDILGMDVEHTFLNFQEGIPPIYEQSTSKCKDANQISRSAKIDQEKDFTLGIGGSSLYRSNALTNDTTISDESENFFDLDSSLNTSSDIFEVGGTCQSDQFIQIITPKKTSSSALQFIQTVYQSDNSLSTEDGDHEEILLKLPVVHTTTRNIVDYSNHTDERVDSISTSVANTKQKETPRIVTCEEETLSHRAKIEENISTKDTEIKLHQNIATESEVLKNQLINEQIPVDNDNLEDIILPVPPEFL